VINVLNRPNVLYARPEGSFEGGVRTRVSYGPQFPIIPTFGIEWRF
jgi:hypothetical protein